MHALRELTERKTGGRYEIVSIDDLLKMSPNEVIYEDDVFEINGLLCGRVLDALKTAPGVIVGHVITSERIYGRFKTACDALPMPTE